MQRDLGEVEMLLTIWADWMHQGGDNVQSYPAKASGGFIESWIKDSSDLADNADAERIAKIDAAFESLKQCYKEPIRRHFNLGYQVWQWGVERTYEEAKQEIRPFLRARCLL